MFGFLRGEKRFADYDELLIEYLLTGKDYLDSTHNQKLFLAANNLPSVPDQCYWKVSEDAQEHIFNAIIHSSEILSNVKLNQNLSGIRSLRSFPVYILSDYHNNKTRQSQEIEKVLEELVISGRALWEYLMLFGNAKNKTPGVINCINDNYKNHVKVDVVRNDKKYIFKTTTFNGIENLIQASNWMNHPHLCWYMHPEVFESLNDALRRRYPTRLPDNIIVDTADRRSFYDRTVCFSYEMPTLSDSPDIVMIMGDFSRGAVAYCQPEQMTVTMSLLEANEELDENLINATVDISNSKKKQRALYCFHLAMEIEITRPDVFRGVKINAK